MKLLLGLILLGIVLGTGFYYRDSLANQIAGLFPDQAIPASPNLAEASPTPIPTATPTPVPAATPAPSPSTTPLVTIAKLTPGRPLPQAGPEMNLALAGGAMLTSGGGLYYASLRRKLRRSWKNIDIV